MTFKKRTFTDPKNKNSKATKGEKDGKKINPKNLNITHNSSNSNGNGVAYIDGNSAKGTN